MQRAFWLAAGVLIALIGTSIGASAASVETAAPAKWIGTWTTAPQSFLPGHLEHYRDQTLRLIVRTSAGGNKVRIRLSNLYGDRPLHIGAAHIATRASDANIVPDTDRRLTFGGHAELVLPAHKVAVSDSVELSVPAVSDLAISLFLPDETQATTSHLLALQTSYVSAQGDAAAAANFPVASTMDAMPFLTGVDVAASANGRAVVDFGDSTVDGDGTDDDANARLSNFLAARLQDAGARDVAVLNEGIVGNRLLRDSPALAAKQFGKALGEAGVSRFERDVLAQPGVAYVLLRIGLNDIGLPGAYAAAEEKVTATQLFAGYRQLIARAHARGIRIVAATLSPFEGAKTPGYYTPEKDALRQQVNAWIRDGGAFDAVIDADAILRDPDHPSRLLQKFASDDHLHPNPDGYAAVARAIPLSLFGVK